MTAPVSKCIRLIKKHGFRGYTLFRGPEVGSRIDDYGRKPFDMDYKPLVDRFRELLQVAKEEWVDSPV